MPKGRIKIGPRLQQILDEQNLRQIDFIRKAEPMLRERGLKLSPNKFNQYVKNRHGPDSDMIELFAEIGGVDPAWLSGFTDIRNPAPDEEGGLDDLDKELLQIIHPMGRESKLALLAGLKSAQEVKE